MDFDRDIIKTGAYVLHEGRFVFMVGFDEHRDKLNIVRLGGHREPGETPVQCAIREVREECTLEAAPFDAPETFVEAGDGYVPLPEKPDSPRPVLIRQQAGAPPGKLLAMYLMRGRGMPKPHMETQGLLSLDQAALGLVCDGCATLRTLRAQGAGAHLSASLPEEMILTPTPQVRFLRWLLEARPAWMAGYLE